ncbi:hypothetical protein KGQ20_25735 [Catenulispora sp. NF23]|uniref:Secreted protein n=1 Tax=Catenulispora pinistramenti TaxID=2705254 RepID=A0ABS5L182_9ACTN|nr:hypothetical protein [Catenulispora pinistramenti]MBS2536170.1 hypothetical protein [Catenulispora pinistramenti]MBS2552086.1 hypothetical protein [Catenulispora pinistramenti]
MITILMVIMVMFLVGLTVLLIGGSVKAARMQSPGAHGPIVVDYSKRLSDEDREYIEESWKNVERVEGTFPDDPEVALAVAHNTVGSVLQARGVDSAQIPATREDAASDSPRELRRQLLEYQYIVSELVDAAPRG